jgi:sec-independent protein translocase protein TatB
MWEIGLIVLIALIVLGPRQLTEAARVVGRLYRELTRMADDMRRSVDLDSITSAPYHYESKTNSNSPKDKSDEDMHKVVDPIGGSGPDFYAELLEQSQETQPGSEAPPSEAESGTEDQPGVHTSDKKKEKETEETGTSH